MKEAVIVSAVRTAVGSYGGALKTIPASDLGAAVIAEALNRAGIESSQVDEVLFGCVLQGGQGQNVARQASLKAGIPAKVAATTVNMVCGSGLKCVTQAATQVGAGEADIMVAGGTENMSSAPYLLGSARWGARMGDQQAVDLMIKDGLFCAINGYHMGITAENVAARYGIDRQEQDRFALESQTRAQKAIESGRFKDEIMPFSVPRRKSEAVLFAQDEHPRETTYEALASLKPAFKKDGTVTAGNASGINDSAAAVVVMSRQKATELALEPLAVIRSHAVAGVDPALMGTGPIPATRKALEKAGWRTGDLDLVEANEAFAVQALAVLKELELDPGRVNVNGGAIALGHPIGASGARILITLLYEMQKRGAGKGLATLCIGGGMGIACALER